MGDDVGETAGPEGGGCAEGGEGLYILRLAELQQGGRAAEIHHSRDGAGMGESVFAGYSRHGKRRERGSVGDIRLGAS